MICIFPDCATPPVILTQAGITDIPTNRRDARNFTPKSPEVLSITGVYAIGQHLQGLSNRCVKSCTGSNRM